MSEQGRSFKEQFTLRGMLVGCIGAIILTCSSMFVALKASSLPWPIMFVCLVSMFFLKLFGNTNPNEINVTHTTMSAGSMVAGGLAFTVPGIYMLDNSANVSTIKMIVVCAGGTLLGLIFTSLLRHHFVEAAQMPYAMGQAAAEVVTVGDEGGKQTGALFGSFGLAGVFTFLRDWTATIPALSGLPLVSYGSYAGFWWSPMLISVGYLIGPVTLAVWFLGFIIGDLGFLVLGQSALGWTAEFASGMKSSVGLGWMVGVGLAITAKEVIPNAKNIFGGMFSKEQGAYSIIPMRWAPWAMLVVALGLIFVCNLPILAVIITLLGVWLTTAMSSQCVGQSAINPMEVFGIFVMAIAKVVCSLNVEQAVFVAAVAAIAAGLTGDVMNDFKAGYILHTDPKAQWIGEAIGGMISSVVSVLVLVILVKAYGGGIFGSEMFPAAQAAAVASVVGGIANVPAFLVAMAAAVVVYFITPMFTMLGLGIYLPGYLSCTAALGALVKLIVKKAAPEFDKGTTGTIIASGLLAGEGFVGVVIALIQAGQILASM